MLTRHIREYLQVTPGPFHDFWVGPGDEAKGAEHSVQLHPGSVTCPPSVYTIVL